MPCCEKIEVSTNVNVNYSLVNPFFGSNFDIQSFRPRMIALRDPNTDSTIAANTETIIILSF
jgi:hypothetical protein